MAGPGEVERAETARFSGAAGRSGFEGEAVLREAARGGTRSTWSLAIWILLEAVAAALATLVTPYGAALWRVPFQLSRLVRTTAFYNPEWLRPPPERFPLFWIAAAAVVLAVLVTALWRRALPRGVLLSALALAILASSQMRHMGLFAIALLASGGAILESAGASERSGKSILDRRLVAVGGSAALALAAVVTLGATWYPILVDRERTATVRPQPTGPFDAGSKEPMTDGPAAIPEVRSDGHVPAGRPREIEDAANAFLEAGRFPVAACERIAAEAPEVRLYNDVQFGGYLIWRFYPPKKVFIDGRNELYAGLLARLGRIHTGDAYEDWRRLVRDYGIEGSIVKYKETLKGVIYPPARPGEPPMRGYRAWSAFLFPATEWALVYFDDTALVFMKRGGRGEPWIERSEYRVLNPEDAAFLLERAAGDAVFAAALRREIERRLSETWLPRSRRTEALLERLLARRTAPPRP
jgi:hypothetical protein